MTKARDLASGIPVPSTVSATELGYLDGVTSAIQTQVDSKLGTSTAASTYQTKAANGLVLLSSTSFSAATSHVVNAFSSTYDNYKIIVNLTSTSTDLELRLRFGNSGTADTTANNQFAYWLRRNNGVDDSFQGTNDTSAFLASCETYSGTRLTNVAFDVYNPFIAAETGGNVQISSVNAAGSPTFGSGGFIKGSSTSWSQFFLITSTGNMTGSVKVYGYNQ